MKVDTIVTEPLYAIQRLPQDQRRKVAADLLEKVGLQPVDLDKYPTNFQGGSASASELHVPYALSRSSLSLMNLSAPWTYPFKPKSSI